MARAKTKLSFSKARPARSQEESQAPWPVLVVDDDPQVHDMTSVLLRDFVFEGRGFERISASSSKEAAAILADRPDIPVMLLDVVMETPSAGLDLVRTVRDAMGNRRIRIILRTGQPGEAPEREVALAYDINDYKSKAELTAQKLFTALVGAIRSWRDIVAIETLNAELRDINATLEQRVADRTAELEASRESLASAKESVETALGREIEAKRQQRQFLSMVSHEFRTPLAVIDTAAQMLHMRALDVDVTMLPRLERIRQSVQRLIALIDACLADEQLESGTMTLHEQAFDMPALLETVLSGIRAAHPMRVFSCRFEAIPLVWGDANLLAMAIGNLIGNAVKYSAKDASVKVSCFVDHGRPAVRISDQGIGIPPEDLPLVFNRFHRGGNVGGMQGSGVGLHMVRQIIDLHGGAIEAESELGKGTSFSIRLSFAPQQG